MRLFTRFFSERPIGKFDMFVRSFELCNQIEVVKHGTKRKQSGTCNMVHLDTAKWNLNLSARARAFGASAG